ncbi:unnamed protein product [Spirodela intermedia]|uniref:Legume lectin domain-containing protein n=1 Tax=Spirodela intermedia TaxID=51605 RepID=A0A7I8K6N0_SPIIN|nr:unnamed protein product [Spirodela intermedia]
MGVSSPSLLICSLLRFSLVLVAGFALVLCEDGGSSSFSFQTFSEPDIALYGDAKVVNSTVRIAGPRTLRSEGRVMYGRRLAFGRRPSFSTYFSFSISPGGGKGPGLGLAFFVAPSNLRQESLDGRLLVASPGVLSVEFVESPDCGVRVHLGAGVPSKMANVSKVNVALDDGEKLQTWIDYGGESKILEVKLSKYGSSKPSEALVSYPVDLSALIWKSAMSVGVVGSSGGNSATTTTLYCWTFWLKHAAAYRMHSDPLDPEEGLSSNPPEKVAHQPARPRADDGYLPGLLTGLFLGVACGAVVTFVAVAFVWAAFAGRRRHPVAPVEYPGAGKKATTVGDGGAGEDS